MDIRPIKGNTWVLEGMEWIPFYKLDERRCILLDTGLLGEREELEQALLDHGLTPAGILCSHAHVDHGGNNRYYFQEKYQIPVALTAKEAGMCAGLLNLKCYFLMLPPGMVEREAAHLVHTPDVIVPDRDGPFTFCGAEFQILQTPGHSAGHIAIQTPDRVCYVGDALLSREQLWPSCPTACPTRPASRAGRSCGMWMRTSLSWPTGECAAGRNSPPSSTTTRPWPSGGRGRCWP